MAVDGEVVDLAEVVALLDLWMRMVSVATARLEPDGTIAKPAALALNSREVYAVVEHQVAPGVFA
jgi:hypothetical protein